MENGQEIVGCWHEIVIFRKYSFRWPRLRDDFEVNDEYIIDKTISPASWVSGKDITD